MNFHWPQYLWLAITVMNITLQCISGHLEKNPSKVPWALFGAASATWILYEGGFFMGVSP